LFSRSRHTHIHICCVPDWKNCIEFKIACKILQKCLKIYLTRKLCTASQKKPRASLFACAFHLVVDMPLLKLVHPRDFPKNLEKVSLDNKIQKCTWQQRKLHKILLKITKYCNGKNWNSSKTVRSML